MNENYEEEHSSLYQVVGETKQNSQFPELASKLESFKNDPKYFKWFTDIYALYLAFNLQEMAKSVKKPFSFQAVSRPHTKFDLRFAIYVLDKVPSLNDRQYFEKLLKKKCKSKFLTMKRSFNKKKHDDYFTYIPEDAEKFLADNPYPTLQKALAKFRERPKSQQKRRLKVLKISNSSEDATNNSKLISSLNFEEYSEKIDNHIPFEIEEPLI